jgi:hypothetical protein
MSQSVRRNVSGARRKRPQAKIEIPSKALLLRTLNPEVYVSDSEIQSGITNDGEFWNVTIFNGENSVLRGLDVRISWRLQIATNPTNPCATVRLMLVRLLEPDAQFSMAQLLSTTGTGWAPHAPLNMQGVGQGQQDRRLIVLEDELRTVSTTFKPCVHGVMLYKFPSDRDLVRYDMEELSNENAFGSIFLCAISTIASGGTVPVLTASTRMRYYDA